jgi:hypothetical protein
MDIFRVGEMKKEPKKEQDVEYFNIHQYSCWLFPSFMAEVENAKFKEQLKQKRLEEKQKKELKAVE